MSAFGRPAVQSRNEEGDLLQNKLVQRQIRDLAQSAVLELKVLQALHLLGLQPAKFLAPPIIRHGRGKTAPAAVEKLLPGGAPARGSADAIGDVFPPAPSRGPKGVAAVLAEPAQTAVCNGDFNG